MVYEARQPTRFNYTLATLCALLSLLGFLVAGVIPSASTRDHGANPLVGWIIVAACLACAAIFVMRARDPRPQVRVDANGVYARAYSPATVPWDAIVAARPIFMRNQRILALDLKDPGAYPSTNRLTRLTAPLNRATGFGSMGINVTFLTGGLQGLVDAMRQHRPDLFEQAGRL
jgi:hypothetical protein